MVKSPPLTADTEFQGKHPGEAFQFSFRQHWIRLLWPFTKLIVWHLLIIGIAYVTFAMIRIPDSFTRRATLILLTFFYLLANFEFLARFYRHYLYVIVITDKKIHRIKKSLIILDDHQSIDLWALQDINKYQHGLIQNLLGFGSIELEAQDTLLRIHFTPAIANIYEKLMHLREQARTQMSYRGTAQQKA